MAVVSSPHGLVYVRAPPQPVIKMVYWADGHARGLQIHRPCIGGCLLPTVGRGEERRKNVDRHAQENTSMQRSSLYHRHGGPKTRC
jgi:hypothetical protein